MSRIRTLAAAGLIALAIGACQGGVSGATGVPALPSGIPTALPSDLASLLPSQLPTASFRQLQASFQEQNGSGVTGGALITEIEDESAVLIGLVAETISAEPQPVAIVEGDCASQTSPPTPPAQPSPEPSAAASPAASPDAAGSPSPEPSPTALPEGFPMWLPDAIGGTSSAIIPLTVADLTAAPHALIVETSYTDTALVACADLVEGGSAPAASPAGSGTTGGASPAVEPSAS